MRQLVIVGACLASASLAAQTFPLAASAGNRTALEGTAPFAIPLRMTQTRITDRNTLSLPLSQWDQAAFDATSRYVFWACEETLGAALVRYDTVTGSASVLLAGDGSGRRRANPVSWNPANDDFRNLDPCLWTPWNTILTGEEAPGGRLFEIMNPLSPSGPYQVLWRAKIPAATHEGLRLDRNGVLYFSDEDHSGSIYKFVPATPGNLAVGQTFVLSVDAFAADPNARPDLNWSTSVNRPIPRFGPATWIPMTDAVGNALTNADPFAFVNSTGGRLAADELRATPFGRCEDMDIVTLANGREALLSALTGETRVISIELVAATTAIVREFVNFDTIDLATGRDVNPQQGDPYTTPGPGTTFNDPDNLAVDGFGGVYILEDAQPGDIWKAIDADRDGVAEAIGIFASLGVAGAEPAGLLFDPNDPYRAICNVLGPTSGNSALWSFRTRPYPGNNPDFELQTGVDLPGATGPGEFVKTITGNHNAIVWVRSPNGTLQDAPFAAFVQPFATSGTAVSFLPALWLTPSLPMAQLTVGVLLLPADGSMTSTPVPPGLAGWSAIVQGLALANGGLVTTDAHEFVLN